ncbi:hypothetical protein [Kutzneria sp. NPDC051319]|uniref:hypothetical protein n=1 Tax=Kutzneria sp. NPDC051319 TaxID=3155047 RepID=UPI0034355759
MLSDQERAELDAAVEKLAWTSARASLGLHPEPGFRYDGDPREQWLATLNALLAIRDSAEQLAASAALSAAQQGADYPEIGAAAGMTRQGARRKWPGLAGMADAREVKAAWWTARGEQFLECVRAVVLIPEAQSLPWLNGLRGHLLSLDDVAPGEALDAMFIDAYTVALNTPTPEDPADARHLGLLAALMADARAATNGLSPLVPRKRKPCSTPYCPAEPVVELLREDGAFPAVPACQPHAVDVLRHPSARIVNAFQPDVALSLFAEVRG